MIIGNDQLIPHLIATWLNLLVFFSTFGFPSSTYGKRSEIKPPDFLSSPLAFEGTELCNGSYSASVPHWGTARGVGYIRQH